jgi:hypothetical protein
VTSTDVTLTNMSLTNSRDMSPTKTQGKKRKAEAIHIGEGDDSNNAEEDENGEKVEQETELTKGKFSIHDTKVILEFLHDFIQARGLSMADVIPQLREEDQPTKHHGFWKELAPMFPNRSLKVPAVLVEEAFNANFYERFAFCIRCQSLSHHTIRQVLKQHGFIRKWTPEEDENLQQMVLARMANDITTFFYIVSVLVSCSNMERTGNCYRGVCADSMVGNFSSTLPVLAIKDFRVGYVDDVKQRVERMEGRKNSGE